MVRFYETGDKSSISISFVYFIYLLKKYQVIARDCVSWSYLYIYFKIEEMKFLFQDNISNVMVAKRHV